MLMPACIVGWSAGTLIVSANAKLQHIKIPVTVAAIEDFSRATRRGKTNYLLPI